jgi:homocysteine S-methyltransferase
MIDSGMRVLTDGATGTRLRLESPLELDPVLDMAGLAASGGGAALQAVAGEYVAIAEALSMPIQLDAMTYWASPDHLDAAGGSAELLTLNKACVSALDPLRSDSVYVAGVLGPRVDGYRGGSDMTVDTAHRYHARQAEALAASTADLILISTQGSGAEALGTAKAVSDTDADYVVGFVVSSSGTLPDGTDVALTIKQIDTLAKPPVHYLVSCTHAATAQEGMRHLMRESDELSSRVLGIKANGSAAGPDALEAANHPLSDPPLEWARAVSALADETNMRVLGGCCGTDSRHILALGLELSRS